MIKSETKKCSRCRRILPVGQFYNVKAHWDGLHNQCKQCSKEHGQRWRTQNRERNRELLKRHRIKRKERFQVRRANYKAVTRDIYGKILIADWVELLNSCNGICPCCNQKVELQIDHITPFCKGGENIIENIQPLCPKCNRTKWKQEIKYI